MCHLFKGLIRDVGMMEFNLCEVPVRSEGNGYNGLLLLLPEIPLLHNLILFFEMEIFAHNISIEKGKFTPFLFFHDSFTARPERDRKWINKSGIDLFRSSFDVSGFKSKIRLFTEYEVGATLY